MSPPARAAFGAAVLAVAITACAPAGSQAVRGNVITIDGVDAPLSFEPREVEVDAGRYTVRFRNEGALPHQLAIGSADDEGEYPLGDTTEVAGGQEASFEVTLEPGRHAFACYVDRHDEAGMTGTLVVR